jgi:hypothetical protein
MQCWACFDKTHKEVIDPLLFLQAHKLRRKVKTQFRGRETDSVEAKGFIIHGMGEFPDPWQDSHATHRAAVVANNWRNCIGS